MRWLAKKALPMRKNPPLRASSRGSHARHGKQGVPNHSGGGQFSLDPAPARDMLITSRGITPSGMMSNRAGVGCPAEPLTRMLKHVADQGLTQKSLHGRDDRVHDPGAGRFITPQDSTRHP